MSSPSQYSASHNAHFPETPAGFNFGEGATELDQYVASVALSPASARRFSASAWTLSQHAATVFTLDGDSPRLNLDGLLPRWLLDAVDGFASPDTDDPVPLLATVTSPHIDWFALVTAHPGELLLTQPVSPGPDLAQLQLGAEFARQAGALPAFRARIMPGHSPADPSEAQLLELVVVGPDDARAAAEPRLTELFGIECATLDLGDYHETSHALIWDWSTSWDGLTVSGERQE